jgi:hypothetical protein
MDIGEAGSPAVARRGPEQSSWGWQSKAQERTERLNTSVDAIRDRFGFKAITLGAGVKRQIMEAPEDPLDRGNT